MGRMLPLGSLLGFSSCLPHKYGFGDSWVLLLVLGGDGRWVPVVCWWWGR